MYQHILIPVSFDEDHANEFTVPVAAALAAEGARVTLLHVMGPIPNYTANYLPEGYRDAALATIETALTDLAGGLPHAQGVVIEGRPGREILGWAEANNVDCIVIPAHGAGKTDSLIGATAAQVARHASCAVHIIR